MIKLETARLNIRDPKPEDLLDWHRLMSDEKTMYYLQDIMTHSLEESKKNLMEAVADIENPKRTKYFLAIELKENRDFVGSIGYTVTDNTPAGKMVHAGYFILPEYHSKGYVSESLHELLRFAFEENSVYRFETGCLVDNISSERVMQKNGMVREGYFMACEWHDGRYKDRVTYRMLKSEWGAHNLSYSQNFWSVLDKLVAGSRIVIDRPKESVHPKYQSLIYPVDYGYLADTASMDGGGIDVWLGSAGSEIDAVICTVDLMKRDSEIKILIGCSEEEKRLILVLHNESEYMKGLMIRREYSAS